MLGGDPNEIGWSNATTPNKTESQPTIEIKYIVGDVSRKTDKAVRIWIEKERLDYTNEYTIRHGVVWVSMLYFYIHMQ